MNMDFETAVGALQALPLEFHQISWLVRDIDVAERFFIDTVGVPKFFKLQAIRAADNAGHVQRPPGGLERRLLPRLSRRPTD